ncbi:transmembrane amino acid transporter protein-domain-containing protein, partial [Filobasidium floriforme]|uniref:transmembrane amino acid transporter protein-domain-containing protein n=1 Tax=Filobasidium floriforme TaxID=5210 RepID=UPI001E8DB283
QGKATIASCVSNLANTIIGSGALAFPSVFASMGLIPAFFSCIFAGACSAFGLYLLSLCARQGYEKPEASFNQIARLTFGEGWATRCFDAAIAIKCFGVSVSYLIIVKTLMPQVILSLSHHLPSETLPEDSMWLDGRLWLLFSLVIVGPLSYLRRMDSLRFTSQIALLSVVYLVIIVVGWWALGVPTGKKRGDVVLGRFGSSTLGSFPIQIFAYTCAQNIFACFNELKFNTQARMNKVITVSIGSAAITYEVLGIVGYLTFGQGVSSNVIAMYPWTSVIIAIGRLGIVLLSALSYPLQAHPCRACIHTLTAGLRKKSQSPDDSVTAADDTDEEDELMNEDKDDHGLPVGKPMGRKKFLTITTGIIVFGFAIAMVIDELETVLSFVGSTGSTIISFILPGMFYFSLFRHEQGITKWMALTLSIYGIVVMVFW